MATRRYGLSGLSPLVSCAIFSLVCLACQARGLGDNKNRLGTAASGPQSDANVSWTRFQDPFEKAFSVDVPHGWTVKGGLFRMGYSDPRPMVDLRSPNGQVSIRIGDVSVPVYTVPAQLHPREGESYDLGAQAQMVVARYRTGPEFAVLYSQARFAKTCRNPQTDLPASDFSVPDYLPMEQTPKQSSGGQVAYRCESSDGARVAFAYTKTALFGDIWAVSSIASYFVPPGQVSAARNILRHVVQSMKINPEWLEYQKRMDAEGMQYQRARQQRRMADLQSQVQQFESKMRAMQSQVNAFERHQAQSASQVEGFTNALVGVTPTTDPLTGQNRIVWTGPKNNYWTNAVGQVVNSNSAPAPGWKQLQPN